MFCLYIRASLRLNLSLHCIVFLPSIRASNNYKAMEFQEHILDTITIQLIV